MSTSDGLSEGDNSDASTSTSTSTGAVTFSVIVPEGSYWRANGNQQPRIFDKPGKLICDCPNHNQSQWPMQNAELVSIPSPQHLPSSRLTDIAPVLDNRSLRIQMPLLQRVQQAQKTKANGPEPPSAYQPNTYCKILISLV
ncbi:unnamed protein product [Penicillium glandicola]